MKCGVILEEGNMGEVAEELVKLAENKDRVSGWKQNAFGGVGRATTACPGEASWRRRKLSGEGTSNPVKPCVAGCLRHVSHGENAGMAERMAILNLSARNQILAEMLCKYL